MPRYLALQWGRAGIRGLAADVTADGLQVRASLAFDWPQDLDAARDAEGVGRWLKSKVSESAAGDCELIVLVPREEIVVRLLALPEAGDEALPDLVRYQTGTRSSVPLNQLAIDFVPLVSAPPNGGRWVQTATVPDRLLQHIQACCQIAELDLSAVGITTVAVGEAVSQMNRDRTAGQKDFVIRLVGEQLEVALWRGPDLLFSHLSRAASAQAAAAEVQRALMSHEQVAADGEIARAWLIARPELEGALRDELASRLGCEVIGFDPSRGASSRIDGLPDPMQPYAAAWGALLAMQQATIPAIDFLHPRRNMPKPNRVKTFAAIAAVVTIVVLAAAYLGSRLYLNSLDRRIAESERTIEKHEQAWQASEPAREAFASLSAWENQRVDWLEQMVRIGAELPDTDRIYLDRWRFELAAGVARGSTEAIGFARQREDAERLTQRLAEHWGLRIRPNPTGSASSDAEYPIPLQLNAEIVSPGRPKAGERE